MWSSSYYYHHQLCQQQYFCSRCGIVLSQQQEAERIFFVDSSYVTKECPKCGYPFSETLKREWKSAGQPQSFAFSSSPPLLPLPKFRTADYEYNSRLTLDIPKIDSILNFRCGESIGIAGIRHAKKYVHRLPIRLCVRALISKRYGGFDSANVIFIDAGGNSSDIYQCVNIARQYGLDIKKVLQSISVSRPFTIYQLAGIILYELPRIIQKFVDTKLIVISDLLHMFLQDPQIEVKEAKSLIKTIANSIRKICSSSNTLGVVTITRDNDNNNCHKSSAYEKILFPSFDKHIEITKEENHYSSLDIRLINKGFRYQRNGFRLQEKDLMTII